MTKQSYDENSFNIVIMLNTCFDPFPNDKFQTLPN